jgi:hypothetical protein
MLYISMYRTFIAFLYAVIENNKHKCIFLICQGGLNALKERWDFFKY